MAKALEKIKRRQLILASEVRKQVVGYIVAALGLVAGLAWNDAVKTLIEFFVPASKNTILAKLAYAALISLVVVVISFALMRWAKGNKDKESREKV